MRAYSLRHLADSTLRHDLKQLVITERSTTARLIAHIAEFHSRKLFLEDGYASMYHYCLRELQMSEDVACERMRAARMARRFPLVLQALADGRLHLTGIALLAPRLTEENAEALLASAFHKSKRQIQRLIAERFPQPDLPTLIESLGAAPATASCSQERQGPCPGLTAKAVALATQPVDLSVPARMEVPVPRPKVTPLAPARIGWQFTTGQETQDLFGEVQDLLGHDVPPGDVEAVLNFALRAAKEKLLKRKCAATARPRSDRHRSKADSRHIPSDVRRAVWERDGGQCTFTSDAGHRCTARKDVEFDHIDPYARDGGSTIGNVRLLCHAHNQYLAERAFGAEFMRHKRIAAAEARAAESLACAGAVGAGP